MQITFHGNSCFHLKEGDFVAVADPSDGFQDPKMKVVTLSRPSMVYKTAPAEAKIFNWPGEYETGGNHFVGIASFHDVKESEKQEENTLFRMEIGGLRLCHLGALGTKLTPEQLESVGDVDILFIPIGLDGTIDAKKAKEVIEQVEPRVMIPMMFNEEKLTAFLKEMGAVTAERLDQFTVKRSELPEEMSKVVVLRPV
jgi:L-ascorbate metabolism protein UlaG (beta-lactamase superfamily)